MALMNHLQKEEIAEVIRKITEETARSPIYKEDLEALIEDTLNDLQFGINELNDAEED